MHNLKFYDTGHRYELNGIEIPSVSEILRFMSRDIYGDINSYILSNAAERGTAVHKATEELDITGSVKIDDICAGYIEAYVKFRREHDVTWECSEKPLYHPIQMYAGTIDRIGYVDGMSALVDIKTSGVVKKSLVKAQLNGYEDMWEANGNRPNDRLYCLQLMFDGRYRLYPCKRDSSEFTSCLILHQALKRKHGRGVIE